MQKLIFGLGLLMFVLLATNLQAQDDLKIKDASGNTLMEVREEGVLITKLTTSERTVNAANLGITENGLLVYDTDTQSFWVWDGSSWNDLVTGDNLGDHTATQNITLGSNIISYDGTSNGIALGSNGAVRIGASSNSATGLSSFIAGGLSNSAPGSYSLNLGGQECTTTGIGSFIGGGGFNETFGLSSFIAAGYSNQTLAENAFASGTGTKAFSYSEAVFGMYNTLYTPGSTTGPSDEDRLFVLGNGSSTSNRSNALTILKNGNVGIGFDQPNNALEVDGTVSATTFTGDGSGLTGVLTAEVDGDVTNELQTLSINGQTLSISNGNNITLPDEDVTNELQTLSISGQTLSISNGNNITLPAGADNLGDHTATQNISLNNEWLSNDGDNEGIYVDTDGQVGIGTADISADVEVEGTVAELRITDDQIQASGAGTELGKISFYSRDGSFGNDYAPVGSIEIVNTNGTATPDAAMEFHVWNNGSTITENTPLVLYPSGKTEITGDLQISGGSPEAGQLLVTSDDSGNTTWENAPKIAFTKDESIQAWDDTDVWRDITSPLSVSTTSNSLILIQAQATVRLISGSNTDAFEFRAVAISSSDGCIQSEVFLNEIFHVPDTDSDGHNQWTTVPYMDNWNPGCAAGTATITLQVRNTGDDSWAVTDAILSLTSY